MSKIPVFHSERHEQRVAVMNANKQLNFWLKIFLAAAALFFWGGAWAAWALVR